PCASVLCLYVFFFSSRRRHTRLVSDWSSDVCSSDLGNLGNVSAFGKAFIELSELGLLSRLPRLAVINAAGANTFYQLYERFGLRSEERRVGKEGRTWGAAGSLKRERGEAPPGCREGD